MKTVQSRAVGWHGEEGTDNIFLQGLDYYLGGRSTAPRFLAWVPDGLWCPFIGGGVGVGLPEMVGLLLDLMRCQLRYSGADIPQAVGYRVLNAGETSE